jgi:hypothetical protein
MVGTAAPSGMAAPNAAAAPTLPPYKVQCTGVWTTQLDTIVWDQSNEPRKQCTGATRQGRPNLQVRPHHLGLASTAQLGQMSHMASVIHGYNASSDPDRRSEVGSIQRTRWASLGSMDPQTSDQPTLGNVQHSTYTKEHALECMTLGPRAGRTSSQQQTDTQPPSNRLRDQNTDAQSNAVNIIGSAAPPGRLLQLPLPYKYPLLQPPTYWGYKLSQAPRGRT